MDKDKLVLIYGENCINNFYSNDDFTEENIKNFITDTFFEELVRFLSDNNVDNNKKDIIYNTYDKILKEYDYKVYDRMEEIISELVNNTN